MKRRLNKLSLTKTEETFGLIDREYISRNINQEREATYRDTLLHVLATLRDTTLDQMPEWERITRADLLRCAFLATLSQTNPKKLQKYARANLEQINFEWIRLMNQTDTSREWEATRNALVTLVNIPKFACVPFSRIVKKHLETFQHSMRVINALERAVFLSEVFDTTTLSLLKEALDVAEKGFAAAKQRESIERESIGSKNHGRRPRTIYNE